MLNLKKTLNVALTALMIGGASVAATTLAPAPASAFWFGGWHGWGWGWHGWGWRAGWGYRPWGYGGGWCAWHPYRCGRW